MSEKSSVHPNKKLAKKPNYPARRMGAALLAVYTLGGGLEATIEKSAQAVEYTAKNIANTVGGSESIKLPSVNTEEGKEEIKQGLENGELIMVKTDEDHQALYNIAETLSPDNDPRPLSDALVAQTGTDQVPLGTEIVVPRTEAAEKLHEQQYPESAG